MHDYNKISLDKNNHFSNASNHRRDIDRLPFPPDCLYALTPQKQSSCHIDTALVIRVND